MPPPSPKFFSISCSFSENSYVGVPFLEGWRPFLQGILDPPLVVINYVKQLHNIWSDNTLSYEMLFSLGNILSICWTISFELFDVRRRQLCIKQDELMIIVSNKIMSDVTVRLWTKRDTFLSTNLISHSCWLRRQIVSAVYRIARRFCNSHSLLKTLFSGFFVWMLKRC